MTHDANCRCEDCEGRRLTPPPIPWPGWPDLAPKGATYPRSGFCLHCGATLVNGVCPECSLPRVKL